MGRFLDPVADKLLIASTVVVLAFDSASLGEFRLPAWVAVIAVGKDVLIVLGFCLIYATSGVFFIQTRIWGRACTLVQLVMISLVLVAPDLPSALARGVPWVWGLASVLAVLATVDYLMVGNKFAAEYHDRVQRRTDDE